MKLRILAFVLPLMFLLQGTICLAEQPEADRPKPNIVLLLVDDLGWQDVKCYDIDEPSPMETPNLDRLAGKGVMFWQGYSPAPVCAPSRAAILSGLHPARGEMTHVAGGYPPHPRKLNDPTISPFFTVRMPIERYTIAEALRANGYRTGHSGKWHISKSHYDYPKPFRHGFDFSFHERGVQSAMKPDRLTGFATNDADDPFRLDENGFPTDSPQQNALKFLEESKDQPFFLYYATWLVHAPIVMRSEKLLRKYETKLGVKLTDEHKTSWKTPGQTNPFYCAMVEQLDYYMGQIFTYLEVTDDPRWPGHKLSENTYIIFTSDNGGMEGGRNEIYTDNFPLDRGKISLKEGGTRVPLFITGPGIPTGVQTDVMANGLDFYPTILSLTGATKPQDYHLDGCDLSPLLKQDPTDSKLVRDAKGQVRDTMFWHFPQAESSSSIRSGDYKLFRKYQRSETAKSLFRLYEDEGGKAKRADIEEMKDVSGDMPELVEKLDRRLTESIEQMGGRPVYLNPNASGLPNSEKAPTVVDHKQNTSQVTVSYRNNGAAVKHADLIYSPNNGREWLRTSGTIEADKVVASIPDGASHYFINLVDENNFVVIHPQIDKRKMKKQNLEYQDVAIAAAYAEPETGEPLNFQKLYASRTKDSAGRHVLLNMNFETGGIRSLNPSGEGASISKEHAAAGKSSLCLEEVQGLKRDWMPMVNTPIAIPEEFTSGTFTVSMDVKLNESSPGMLAINLRDTRKVAGRKPIAAGQVSFAPDGLSVDGRNVSPVAAGQWHHLELSGQVGANSKKFLAVSLSTSAGKTWTRKVPYNHYHFDQPTELQLLGLGPEGTSAFIDNVVVSFSELTN